MIFPLRYPLHGFNINSDQSGFMYIDIKQHKLWIFCYIFTYDCLAWDANRTKWMMCAATWHQLLITHVINQPLLPVEGVAVAKCRSPADYTQQVITV